jgi:hypothetical protein
VLTSGRGSTTLEPRWSSPKQAGKDVSLNSQIQSLQRGRSYYIPSSSPHHLFMVA